MYMRYGGFPGSSVVKNLPASAGDVGFLPGLGRSPGEGMASLLRYSCLGNPVDRGVWRAAAHGVTKSHTWLSNSIATTRYRPPSGIDIFNDSSLYLEKILFLISGGTALLSSIVSAPIYISTNRVQGSLFSTASPTVVISCLFDNVHTNRCEVTPPWGFDLHFPED